MDEIKITINRNKRYSLPINLSIRMLRNKRILIIDAETPNWITLKSNQEYLIFKALRNGKTINEIIKYLQLSEINGLNNLKSVLIEIHNSNFFLENSVYKSIHNNFNLTIYLTDKCNLKCIHCYRHNHNSKFELSARQWENVILQFSQLKNRGEFVTFSGGEVSLRKDFKDILAYTFSLGLKSIILTNGILWKSEDFEEIVKYAYEIQISLDGINELQNDKIRGEGTFRKVIDNLKIIVNHANVLNPNLRIALAMTFIPQDLLAIEKGIKDFRNRLERTLDRKIIFRISTRLKPGRKIINLNLNEQNQYRQNTIKIKNIIFDDNYWESKLMSVACFSPFIKIRNCGFGQNISILANGDVMACSDSNFEFFGNVEKRPLKTIKSELTNLFICTSIENMELCKNCELKYICGGGCRLDNLKYTGSYLNPSICIKDKDFKDYIYNIMADKREWSWNYSHFNLGGSEK